MATQLNAIHPTFDVGTAIFVGHVIGTALLGVALLRSGRIPVWRPGPSPSRSLSRTTRNHQVSSNRLNPETKRGLAMPRYSLHRRYAPLVAAMCLVLAGCGGSSGKNESTGTTGGQPTASSGKGNTKPCGVLTVDELEAATGFTAQAGSSTVQVGVSRCEWPIDYGSTGGDFTVSVDLTSAYPAGNPDDPSRWVQVSGVEDEAVWSMDQSTLYVDNAQQDFSIHVGVSDDAKQRVIAKTLALKVLERL